MAETIDKLKETIKSHHVDRLQTGDCGIAGGIALVDLVTSFERISSHCANVSLHIIKRVENDLNFDEMHGHANDSFSEEYKALYHYYESQYITPIVTENILPDANSSKKEMDKKDLNKKTPNKKNSGKNDNIKKNETKKENSRKEAAKEFQKKI